MNTPDQTMGVTPTSGASNTPIPPHNASTAPSVARMHRLGKYDIIAKLGQGGMAEVYLAMSRAELGEVKKLLVLKVLHESLRNDDQFIEMFMREAKISVRLNHPHVISTFTVGQEGGRYCIVMEYLEGVPLSAVLKKAREWSPMDRLPLLSAVNKALIGLHYVHEFTDYEGTHLRLVHRDFKPSNIFVTFDGQVKVLDFGVAKVTAGGMDATMGHTAKGTVKYMAPEILNAPARVDRRSDLFGAGLTIWDVVAGKNPWAGLTDFEVLRSLLSGQIAEPLTHASPPDGFPPEIFELVRWATAPELEDRPESALRLRQELAQRMDALGVSPETERLQEIVAEIFGEMRRSRKVAIGERLRALEQWRGVPEPPVTHHGQSVPFLGSMTPGSGSSTNPQQGSSTHGLDGVGTGSAQVQSQTNTAIIVSLVMLCTALIVGGAFYLGATLQQKDAEQATGRDAAEPEGGPPSEAKPDGEAQPEETELAAAPEDNEPAEDVESPPEPESFEIDATVRPTEAALFLDGEALPSNPATIVREDDGEPHLLVAKADGYAPLEVELRFDRNQTLQLSMVPNKDDDDDTKKRRRRRRARTTTPKNKPAQPPEEPTPSPPTPPPPSTPKIRPGDDLPTARTNNKKPGMEIDSDISWGG